MRGCRAIMTTQRTRPRGHTAHAAKDARRLRAPQGEALPPGVHAFPSARNFGDQGENRTAADARARNREEKSKASRQEMVGE